MSKRVCVYCSSSNFLEDRYVRAAKQFAKAASLLNYTIVCGGSIKGRMGIIIDVMLQMRESGEGGGYAEGVIPSFMEELELYHPRITTLKITDTMSQRKELLRENTDAVIAFPGGLGTLEEFVESFTLKRLGQYDGSVILFNMDGFYNKLLELFEIFVENRMMNSNYRDNLIVVETVDQLIDSIGSSNRERLDISHYLPI